MNLKLQRFQSRFIQLNHINHLAGNHLFFSVLKVIQRIFLAYFRLALQCKHDKIKLSFLRTSGVASASNYFYRYFPRLTSAECFEKSREINELSLNSFFVVKFELKSSGVFKDLQYTVRAHTSILKFDRESIEWRILICSYIEKITFIMSCRTM